jgi:hypothetical protein
MGGAKRYTHQRAVKRARLAKIRIRTIVDSTNLLVAEVQELIELDATIRESSEDPFFLELGGEFGVSNVSHGRYVECGLEMWMMWSEGRTGYSGELYSRSR